jgi:hypothetical protein
MKNPGKVSLMILFLSTLTSADIIYVPSDTTSIQGGIFLAGIGDTVLVDRGTYEENIDFKGKAITVASYFIMADDSNHIANTIIDGSQFSNKDSASVVYFGSGEDTTSVLCGFTITGGIGTRLYWAAGDFYFRAGGGIGLYFSGGKIIHNKIINNHIQTADDEYGYGGGLDATGKVQLNLVVRDNEISYNTVDTFWGAGAGIDMGRYGYILVESNIIANNTFTANGGFSGGGGFYIFQTDSGEVFVKSNKILNNKALSTSPQQIGKGGGLYIENCSPYLFNNICAGNSAGIGGGLMIIATAGYKKIMKPVLINNTIIHNQAIIGEQIDSYGGGIYLKEEHFENLTNPVIINTILWDNTADLGSQIYIARGSIDVAYSDIQEGWVGPGNIDTGPLFQDTLYNLSESSPCVGSGTDSIQIDGSWYVCPNHDLNGNLRPNPVDEMVDMGAIESQHPTGILKEDLNFLPAIYRLEQNYPNPFNPRTVISWQLAVGSDVELSIYNLLGQKVATLVAERQNPGSYQAEWDASGFSSGVYYYRLSAGEFVETKKLVLLK